MIVSVSKAAGSDAPEETDSSGVFVCRRCGNCCRKKGEVAISSGEAEKIAALLEIGFGEFMDRFTAISSDRRQLLLAGDPEKPCVFLEETGGVSRCRIEKAKPRQCRDFPLRWNYPGWEKTCVGGKKE